MNLPKPQPESTEQHPELASNLTSEQLNIPTPNAAPVPAEAPRAPLGGVIERDLADPNKATNSPDPQQVQSDDPVVIHAPTVSQSQISDDPSGQAQSTSSSNSNPAIADDVDVIEKEWVDKAKQIINQTKDDPYRQEQEVEKLQQDYMLKRYGKQIKPAQ